MAGRRMTTGIMFEVGDEVRFENSPNTEIIVNINEEGEINGKYHTGTVSGSCVDPKRYTLVKKAKEVVKTGLKKGDRVKLVASRYGDSPCNPIWGGSQGCIKGVITRHSSGVDLSTGVTWDNGLRNTYDDMDLALLKKEVVKTVVEFKVGETIRMLETCGHCEKGKEYPLKLYGGILYAFSKGSASCNCNELWVKVTNKKGEKVMERKVWYITIIDKSKDKIVAEETLIDGIEEKDVCAKISIKLAEKLKGFKFEDLYYIVDCIGSYTVTDKEK